MRSLSATLALACALVISAAPAEQPAIAGPPGRQEPGCFVPVGLNLGVAFGEGDPSFVLGAELSAVHLFGTSWVGAWADLAREVGAGRWVGGAGVEAGWFVFGAELGWVAEERGGGEVVHGVRVGAVISGGFLASYLRWSHLLRVSAGEEADGLEVGVLIKWPLAL